MSMMIEDMEDDNEPYIADEAIGEAATPEAQAAERAAFEARTRGVQPLSEVERLQALTETPAAPVARAPTTDPAITEMLSVMKAQLDEMRASRPAPVEKEAPPPEPTLTERFDRDPEFARAALKQAGFQPDEKGTFTLEAARAVRAELRLADFEQRQEKLMAERSASESDRQLRADGEAIMGRLAAFEPLSELQQEALGAAIGGLQARGIPTAQAIDRAFQDFAPLLRAKGTAARRAAPAAPRRAAPSVAAQIVATPGMTTRAVVPKNTWDRLDQARREYASRNR